MSPATDRVLAGRTCLLKNNHPCAQQQGATRHTFLLKTVALDCCDEAHLVRSRHAQHQLPDSRRCLPF
jgi:hypothetical protein